MNRGNLRVEKSINCSGKILNIHSIPLLKEKNYIVKKYDLDGDAPKQFIKAYFYEEGSTTRKKSPNSWIPYIAKTAEKWYPHESVIEFMINRIGQTIGLNMNEIKLVKANQQIRFLSRYFKRKNETLIHGAEICGEYLEDFLMAREIANDKPSSRKLFTFEFIKDAIRTVFPDYFENILFDLIKMLAFDALVGNNDRHFYNWGIITTLKKSKKSPTFAPIYDSARGLLWNYSDENVTQLLQTHKQGGKKLVKYINDACPRISIESNTQANHFQLIDFIKRYNNDYKKIVEMLASIENEQNVIKMLNKEFFHLFIPERSELILLILRDRFKKIREV